MRCCCFVVVVVCLCCIFRKDYGSRIVSVAFQRERLEALSHIIEMGKKGIGRSDASTFSNV